MKIKISSTGLCNPEESKGKTDIFIDGSKFASRLNKSGKIIGV